MAQYDGLVFPYHNSPEKLSSKHSARHNATMIQGVCETIKELVAARRVGKGTAEFVRKSLEKDYSSEFVRSKDVDRLIAHAIVEYVGVDVDVDVEMDQSEDDMDVPAYDSETPPRSNFSRALSIQTSHAGFSEAGMRRKRPLVRAVSPKKDPDKPAIEEGVIFFRSERNPVSCCFSTEDVNYIGDHVLNNFKERNLLTAEIEENTIELLFRKDGDTRTMLLEFEIRPKFSYDLLLGANWREHKERRETTNQIPIISKSNERVNRRVKQERGHGIVAKPEGMLYICHSMVIFIQCASERCS